jgi:haloacid dehalogenase superfamily, subfamily IA, variant 3 with third motif having DD or ED
MINEAIIRYLERKKQIRLSLKAVLFDMDGILFDSMKHHARAWHEVSTSRNLVSSPEDFYMYEGCTGNYTINELYKRTFGRAATEEEIKDMYKEKSDLFTKYNKGERMANAIDVLDCVRGFGLECLVVTGSGQRSLIDKLNTSFPNYFKREKMVTAFDVKKGKPDPEPYLTGLQKAEAQANEAIVVENAPMGVQAGVAAGIFTIAVNTGPLDDKLLLDSGADLLYRDMASLAKDWLKIMSAASELSV